MLPKINIYSSDFAAEEGSNTASFTFTRTGDLQNALSCSVAFAGTAVSGVDFEPMSETVNFAAGQDTVTLLINPKSDGKSEGAELVTCTIQDNVAYSIENASAKISIHDKGYVGDGFVAKLDDTFLLHSKPDAKHTIYLDFFGGDYYSYNTILSYNSDGDASNLSDAEKLEIQKIWAGIAEDFAPFNIDVTTETPADGALVNTGGDDDAWGVSLLIGEETTGYGFAWSGSEFPLDYAAPGYVSINSQFQDGIYPLTLIATGGSHEIAHTMGLSHDGPGSGRYYSGHDTTVGHWNTIMGLSTSGLTQFSKGDYANADNTEDDLSIIASDLNGISYIVDEHADERSFATELVKLDDGYGSLFAQGIISTSDDVDWFYFDHSGGSIVLNVDVAEFSPNLHAGAWLYDSNGGELIASTSESSLSAAIISPNLSAGRYYLKVDGIGNDSGGGYTDYGSLGQYEISSGVGVLASYDPDNQSAGDSIAGTTQFSSLSLGGLSGASVGNGMWEDVWALWWDARSQIDTSEYISFAVTPGGNEELALSSLSASFYSFSPGETHVTLRSSLDDFTNDIDSGKVLGGNSATLIEFDLETLPRVDASIEFRLHMTSESGSGFRYLTGSNYQYDTNAQGIKLVGRVLSQSNADTTPKIMGSFDFGYELTSTEVAVDATLTVTTSNVEDGQLVTLALNGKTYTGEVSANRAQIVVETTDLMELSAGAVSYTLSVSNSANIPAADYVSEFVYDLAAERPASAQRATNINEKVRLDQQFNELVNESSSEVAQIEIVSGPVRGSLENDAQGHWYYVPDQNYLGDDSFSFRATSSSGEVSEVMAFDLMVKDVPTIQPTPENPFSPSSSSSATDAVGRGNCSSNHGARIGDCGPNRRSFVWCNRRRCCACYPWGELGRRRTVS